jgi:hypothetical protein
MIEKLSFEDAMRAKTDAELAESVAWADHMESESYRRSREFVRMLADAPGSDHCRVDSFTAGLVRAVRAETRRRAAGGEQDPDAVSKYARVMARP